MMSARPRQLALALDHAESFAREDFLSGSSNAVALALISIPRAFPALVRLLGLVAAIMFAATAVQIFAGVPILPTSSPLRSCSCPQARIAPSEIHHRPRHG